MTETTDAARWQRVKVLVARVLDLPEGERARAIERLSAGDPDLRDELRSLVDAHEGEGLAPLPPALALQALDGAAAVPVGRRVGAWRIVSLIARGGMGEVYVAERADGQFDQRVALKLLRSGVDQEWSVARFAAERQILAGLQHPNLARLLDGGTTAEGTPYFVMELVEGQSIDRYCDAHALDVRQRLALFRTVCQVVGYAHSKGIVHRDIKCENVLVTAAGVVKLVDFGIAKRIAPQQDTTATAHRMMTLAYSSPEQVRGGEVGPESDVYSLGVVLYRLLTGTSPYGRPPGEDSGYELTRAICDTAPVPPSRSDHATPALGRQQRRRLRGDLDAVVLKALRKDPADRYRDANEFGDDVFRHLENLPVRARRGDWSYRIPRFVLRHRAAIGAVMAVNVALLAGLAVAIVATVEARRERERAERHMASTREFANVLMLDVNEALADVPGASRARQILVDKATVYLERVSRELPDDPAARLDLIRANRRLAEIRTASTRSPSGDIAGALSNARTAVSLCESMDAEHVERRMSAALEAREAFECIVALRTAGRLSQSAGDVAAASALMARAVALGRARVAAAPGDRSAQGETSAAERGWARVRMLEPVPTPAAALLDAARERTEALLAASPDDLEQLRALARAHVYLAQLKMRLDPGGRGPQTAAALADYDVASATFARLLAIDPASTVNIRDMGVLEVTRGLTYFRLGRYPEAIAAHQRAQRASAKLVEADPTNQRSQLDLAQSDMHLGYALIGAGRLDEADAPLRQAVEIYETALRAGRLEHDHRVALGDAHTALGEAAAKRAAAAGGAAKAAAHQADACREFRAAERVLIELDPSRTDRAAGLEQIRAPLQACR